MARYINNIGGAQNLPLSLQQKYADIHGFSDDKSTDKDRERDSHLRSLTTHIKTLIRYDMNELNNNSGRYKINQSAGVVSEESGPADALVAKISRFVGSPDNNEQVAVDSVIEAVIRSADVVTQDGRVIKFNREKFQAALGLDEVYSATGRLQGLSGLIDIAYAALDAQGDQLRRNNPARYYVDVAPLQLELVQLKEVVQERIEFEGQYPSLTPDTSKQNPNPVRAIPENTPTDGNLSGQNTLPGYNE